MMPCLSIDAVLPLQSWQGCGQLRDGLLSIFVWSPTKRRFLFALRAGDVFFGGVDLVAIAEEETWVDRLEEDPGEAAWRNWEERFQGVFRDTEIALPLVANPQEFYAQFWASLEKLETWRSLADRERLQAKSQQDQRFSERAIADLTAIFQKTPIQPQIHSQDKLLAAMQLVGDALGIEIKTPAFLSQSLYSPLEQIAFASRVRLRKVKLQAHWWRSDCGMLLGYSQDGQPIALLNSGDRYIMVDPVHQTRVVINRETAQQLQPWAYFFYRPLPEKILTTWDIVRFALRGRQREIASITVIGIAASLVGMIIPLVTGLLIDLAIPNGDRRLLLDIGLCLGAVSLGSTVFNIAQGVAVSRLQSFADMDTQTAVWDRLLKLRANFFRQYSVGDLQNRVSAIAQIRQLMSGTILQTIFSSVFSLLTLGIMLFYSPVLTGVVVIMALAIAGVTNILSLKNRQKLKPLQEMQGQLSGLMVQMIASVGKLRVAGAERRAFAFWAHRLSQILRLTLSTEAIEDGMVLFNSLLSVISPLLLFSLATTAIAAPLDADFGRSGLSTAIFLAFNSAAGIFMAGVAQLSSIVVRLVEISILWERAQPILKTLPEVTPKQIAPGILQGNIRCEDLCFRYSLQTPQVLDHLSLEIAAGEFVAIVGGSGSGKSTLARLLLGFEQPEKGVIYYDNKNLADLDIMAVRRQLGVVLQNGRIEGASVFENLAMGAEITEAEAWQALHLVGVAEDIAQMPMGLDTMIAEGGVTFSGGQRQRILIARALVRHPRILIFDEATSFLDNQTQAIVTESLRKLQVTRLVIAHRLSTIEQADRIYVLSEGRISQQGTFQELMAQTGQFRELMKYQQSLEEFSA